MDEVTDTGIIAPDNPTYYQNKAVIILNALQMELTPASQEAILITSLSDEITVSDRLALLVLPYGLAAHLMMAEGDSGMTVASFLNNRYEELKRKNSSSIQPIEDKYDVLGGWE